MNCTYLDKNPSLRIAAHVAEGELVNYIPKDSFLSPDTVAFPAVFRCKGASQLNMLVMAFDIKTGLVIKEADHIESTNFGRNAHKVGRLCNCWIQFDDETVWELVKNPVDISISLNSAN